MSDIVPMPLSARLTAIAAMALVVVSSNVLVQFPVDMVLGRLNLADLLTWGAFTYPAAFLVTDLTNRRFGAREARRLVHVGFVIAVIISALLATPRIAIASGMAYLVGQLLDVTVFNRLRRSIGWWQAPFVASILGSIADTTIFFSLAFAPVFAVIGASDAFALEATPLLGLFSLEAGRWISWAVADFSVKFGFAIFLLAPYRVAVSAWQRQTA
jgi:uncharacterized PurR-regulated membrane protein YhhQ (DUF165 family)